MKTEKTDQNFLIRLSVFIRGKKAQRRYLLKNSSVRDHASLAASSS
jgi:hypothetical protein